ncbi:hypothetical protein BAMA_20125 [Bacillus manliponensis]|uniref:Uncharacterized protein n=1 Tax=Bacillus manliponensis TaxID=574376 RepID=A0A073K478_9BACI|nr:hypothetical protein [Bacillus manliponensis]KEK17073.1 hypothetical protein BAMA_20125 [Bacillus manliponensis]
MNDAKFTIHAKGRCEDATEQVNTLIATAIYLLAASDPETVNKFLSYLKESEVKLIKQIQAGLELKFGNDSVS